MKNKLSTDRWSYFFTPRIHGNVFAWVQPDSASVRSKPVMENILRWADDGGQMLDLDPAPHPSSSEAGEKRAHE
jgi:hypothetical protein